MDEGWVAVLGADPVSRAQLNVCQSERPATLAGAILCDDEANRAAPLCAAVSHFPAFCHQETRECRIGYRGTRASLEALATANPTPAPAIPESTPTLVSGKPLRLR